jgi:SAM-dependent methyltransferase
MIIEACRLCGSSKIEKVIDLGLHPLADTFLPQELLFESELSHPLQLALCQECGHVSTMYVVSAVDRYQKHDYSYDSSNSAVSIAHFKDFSQAVLQEKRINSESLIVDIGSNVGTLLSHFKNFGYTNVIGVEPSKNICNLANSSGINTLNSFFDVSIIDQLGGSNSVEVLLSSNVVNHADDLNSFLQVANAVLAPNGIFVFEVPYLLNLINTVAFDTIYHEHVHYYGIKPLALILERHGFFISKIDQIDYMCGSIRVYAKFGKGHATVCNEMIKKEEDFGLYTIETYNLFMRHVRKIKVDAILHLAKIKSSGGRIVGIGAATKGNTFLNYCNLDVDIISCISEASLLKIGKYTPGSRIPIIHDNDINNTFTHALILPWNIAPMLKKKLKHLDLEFYIPQFKQNLHNNI